MINLYINQRAVGNVMILDLKGRVRIGGTTISLHRSIRNLVEEGKMQILLNLANVTAMDSCGLGELVASQITLSTATTCGRQGRLRVMAHKGDM